LRAIAVGRRDGGCRDRTAWWDPGRAATMVSSSEGVPGGRTLSKMFGVRRSVSFGFAVLLAVGACGAHHEPSTVTLVGSCAIPPETYNDLAACNGAFEFLESSVADSVRRKSSAKIVVASKNPEDILAGLGAYMKVEGTTDSFVVSAYGSNDRSIEGRFNRGRLLWNFRGPITVEICTQFAEVRGFEICTDQIEFTVSNRDPSLPPIPEPRRSEIQSHGV
jgi:hypothetical protein